MKLFTIIACLLLSITGHASELMVELSKQHRQHFSNEEVRTLGQSDMIIPVKATDLPYQIIDIFDEFWFNISENGVRILHSNSSSTTWLIDNDTRNSQHALFVVTSNRKIEGYIASLSKCRINGCIKNQGVIYLDKYGSVVKLYMNR